ncbi:hypothetical protein Tco_0408156 [Tanacetum coccineum]
MMQDAELYLEPDVNMLGTDQRRQTVISELLKADYRRQRQLAETLKIVKSLKAQMTELQRQQGPAKDPAEPELPERCLLKMDQEKAQQEPVEGRPVLSRDSPPVTTIPHLVTDPIPPLGAPVQLQGPNVR